jgi:hypothetical protein
MEVALHKKKNPAYTRNLRKDFFPIRHNWRFWIACFGPVPLAFLLPWLIEPTLLNALLFITFYMLVVRSFSRLMVQKQTAADRRRRIEWRAEVAAEVAQLEKDYAAIAAMFRALPPELQADYAERLKGHALKLLTLKAMLSEWQE